MSLCFHPYIPSLHISSQIPRFIKIPTRENHGDASKMGSSPWKIGGLSIKDGGCNWNRMGCLPGMHQNLQIPFEDGWIWGWLDWLDWVQTPYLERARSCWMPFLEENHNLHPGQFSDNGAAAPRFHPFPRFWYTLRTRSMLRSVWERLSPPGFGLWLPSFSQRSKEFGGTLEVLRHHYKTDWAVAFYYPLSKWDAHPSIEISTSVWGV